MTKTMKDLAKRSNTLRQTLRTAYEKKLTRSTTHAVVLLAKGPAQGTQSQAHNGIAFFLLFCVNQFQFTSCL